MKQLIVTADDFGLSLPVNEAVEEAYTQGILTSASLMVTAPAAADAIARARRLDGLGVGLHLTFVDGLPALPAEEIPDLVGADGRLHPDPVKLGIKLFFQQRLQRQVEAEMRAQLALFRATGLPLDHVDGHHHFHQHPTIVGMIVKMAKEFGIKHVRLPQEPLLISWRAQGEGLGRRLCNWFFPVTRFTGMRQRLAAAGIVCNDYIFGLHESGRMTPECVDRFLAALPEGVSELYCHPAKRRWEARDNLPAHYLCVEEYKALADPERRERLRAVGVERRSFSELV